MLCVLCSGGSVLCDAMFTDWHGVIRHVTIVWARSAAWSFELLAAAAGILFAIGRRGLMCLRLVLAKGMSVRLAMSGSAELMHDMSRLIR